MNQPVVYFDGVSLTRIQGDEPTPQELLDAVPNESEFVAVPLPAIDEPMDIDESSIGHKEFTYQTLVWNYAASVHNSEYAIQNCIQNFSNTSGADEV